MDTKRNNKGFVILLSVILMFMTASVAAAVLLVMLGQYQLTSVYIKHTKAYYRDEAGLVRAIWRVRNNDVFSSEDFYVRADESLVDIAYSASGGTIAATTAK